MDKFLPFTDPTNSQFPPTDAPLDSSPPPSGGMKQKTWPPKFESPPPFIALHLVKKQTATRPDPRASCKSRSSKPPFSDPHSGRALQRDYSQLPYDVLGKIAAAFSWSDLRAASLACKSWGDALLPLREAMLFLSWGKRFKHGRGEVKPNLAKALDCFLKGAARGSTLSMVDAGLLYWEMGRKEEGIDWYRKAAVLGDPTGQCNLGICFLQGETSKWEEGVKWLYKACVAGHVRAQYQIALCFHQGRGVHKNFQEAAKWYLKAAEGGYVRAMYNTSLCYSFGEGLAQSHKLGRKWMKKAADRGHCKAQFEHGLHLLSEGDMMNAVVYLELATRAGEAAASHVKNAALQQLSPFSRSQAMILADNWRASHSSR
ncbi:hypothetical protein DM860_006975 [Cuscuta australis]|uniref:F-box domain-containing protein n=1 Tax=Cuscuta australis TaxID=267555 RepID=A0A328E9R7_9ASTE|nr:hypothetical protein DM860_006975 [Cuscuta australis]